MFKVQVFVVKYFAQKISLLIETYTIKYFAQKKEGNIQMQRR